VKIAVLADIHGNLAALQAVLAEVDRLSINKLLIAGDFVGYYYQPQKVLAALAKYDVVAVKGNHETFLPAYSKLSSQEKKVFCSKYGSAIEKALQELNTQSISWLLNLPAKLEIKLSGKKVVLCHGSPFDPDEYIYPDAGEEKFAQLANLGADLIVMGHTHYPMVKKIGQTIILNPGSVGQPRQGQPGANWAILDDQTLEIELCQTNYDLGSVEKEVAQYDPEVAYLASILRRGGVKDDAKI